jgi:hypothetical protein
MRAFLILLASLALLQAPAFAGDFTDAERAALAAQIETFDAAMRVNDFATVIGTIPPAFLAHFAKGAGLSTEDFIQRLPQMMEAGMQGVELQDFSMSLEDAQFLELSDGTPYALVPTETTFKLAEKTYRATGDTLGLYDNGTWYLVRVSEAAQVEVLVAVYPAFADVTFAPSNVEVISE